MPSAYHLELMDFRMFRLINLFLMKYQTEQIRVVSTKSRRSIFRYYDCKTRISSSVRKGAAVDQWSSDVTLNLSRAPTFSRWYGVELAQELPAQKSSSSLDRGSDLRGPSPKAPV
ncbi:hypothetical protein TNCV_4814101 [Trichonephila clavipes]|nr:hypothetical protein TNCV_4814101 [Trichonephila clavipes]